MTIFGLQVKSGQKNSSLLEPSSLLDHMSFLYVKLYFIFCSIRELIEQLPVWKWDTNFF